MGSNSALVVAMAEQCRSVIQQWDAPVLELPAALQPKHLLWMCSQIEDHAEYGSVSKLNRWIGFIQGAMLAHRMLDLDGLKKMFNEAKRVHEVSSDDSEDLTDHLDPLSSFEFDLGGQG